MVNMDKKPVIIENFMSQEDVKVFIDYMDKNEGWFKGTTDNAIFNMYTGRDNFHDFETKLDDPKFDEIRSLIVHYSNKIENSIKEKFLVDHSLYLSQFWMTKRLPSVAGKFHNDNDDGINYQIKYSGIIYLNSMDVGGELCFPRIKYTYHPKSGDIVLFDSHDKDFLHGVSSSRITRYALPIWITDIKEYALIDGL